MDADKELRPLIAGARIGPYTILSRLGAGGMGEVYRAHDANLGRDVALKLLPRAQGDDPAPRERLRREARAAASLNHPNICTLYEVGDADGRIFIAMEVIEGQALSDRLEARPLPLDEVVRFGCELADAVAHAHERGVIHRDLKSANVMITRDGRLKVLDFGLAKLESRDTMAGDGTVRVAPPLTEPLAILGTLPYMSPEQLRGQPADARSDVWALGIVLYEMGAGSRPFQGTTAFEVSSAILNDPPPPLPAGTNAALSAVIGRCLEKEPARRYQRASELKAALEMVRAAPASQVAHRRFAGRPRAWPMAAGAVAALLAIAAAVWWNRAARPQPSAGGSGLRIQSIAVLPLENRSGDTGEDYFVTGLHEALITDLARIGLQKVIAKPSADAFKGTTKSLREIGRELGVEGLVTGSVMRANDRIQIAAQLLTAETGAVLWANRYERNAGDVLSLQNEVVSAIAHELRATLTPEQTARLSTARPVNAAAHDAYLKGRSMQAALSSSGLASKPLQAVIAQFDEAIRLDPTYAPPYAALTGTYLTASQGSLLPPKDTFPKARAAALKAVQLDDTLSDAHAALGEVQLWFDWDWAAADREIQRALQLNPNSADALRASEVYATLVAARFDDAARISERIISLDPLNPFSRLQPIWISFNSRRHDESIRHANTMLELFPNKLMSPFFLAQNYARKGMGHEVGVHCEKVMALLSGGYVMQPIGQCAWAYGAVGKSDEARRLVRLLEHPPAGIWLDPVVMGSAYGGLGEIDRAMVWFQKGVDERSPNMIYMKVGAAWDSVRRDPRFQAMLRQMNFPP